LRAKIAQILTIVENSQGDANTADEAEQRAVEEVRKLGQEVLGAWAVEKEQQLEQEYDRRRDYRRKGKKVRWLSRFGRIEVVEQVSQAKFSGKQVRPFGLVARVLSAARSAKSVTSSKSSVNGSSVIVQPSFTKAFLTAS
jgi:hypothetical protein